MGETSFFFLIAIQNSHFETLQPKLQTLFLFCIGIVPYSVPIHYSFLIRVTVSIIINHWWIWLMDTHLSHDLMYINGIIRAHETNNIFQGGGWSWSNLMTCHNEQCVTNKECWWTASILQTLCLVDCLCFFFPSWSNKFSGWVFVKILLDRNANFSICQLVNAVLKMNSNLKLIQNDIHATKQL